MSAMDRLALGDLASVVRRVQLVPNPAAGADFVVTVPGDQVWKVLAVNGLLTASANVATRFVRLTVDDSTATVMRITSVLNQVASQAVQYSWVAGITALFQPGTFVVTGPLPAGLILGPGYRIGAATLGIDVADQWSAVNVWIEQQQTGVTDLAVARQAADELYDEPL